MPSAHVCCHIYCKCVYSYGGTAYFRPQLRAPQTPTAYGPIYLAKNPVLIPALVIRVHLVASQCLLVATVNFYLAQRDHLQENFHQASYCIYRVLQMSGTARHSWLYLVCSVPPPAWQVSMKFQTLTGARGHGKPKPSFLCFNFCQTTRSLFYQSVITQKVYTS